MTGCFLIEDTTELYLHRGIFWAHDLEKEKVDELKASNRIVDIIIKPVSLKALPLDKVQQALH